MPALWSAIRLRRRKPSVTATFGRSHSSAGFHSRFCMTTPRSRWPASSVMASGNARARALPLAITEDAGHRALGVVIQNRLWNPAEECERPNVAVTEGFRRLSRIADHKAGIRVRQVKSEEVDLALYAPDDADGFTKVCLSMPRRMHQRHEHLLRPLPPTRHVILHNRDAACEAVLVPKPLEDPLRRMPLLLRSRLVVPKNAVDQCNKWIELRLRRRLLAHITRRHREPYHLGNCSRIKPNRRAAARSLKP